MEFSVCLLPAWDKSGNAGGGEQEWRDDSIGKFLCQVKFHARQRPHCPHTRRVLRNLAIIVSSAAKHDALIFHGFRPRNATGYFWAYNDVPKRSEERRVGTEC